MKNDIHHLVKADADYKEKSAKIAELKAMLSSFEESLQYNLDKRSKLQPKAGVPKSYEEIATMERGIRELKTSISKLPFWEGKEKRRLRTLLAEQESRFQAEYHIYYLHEEWNRIEKDVAYFSQCVENYKQALEKSELNLDAACKARAAVLSDLTRKINAASPETLKSVFSAHECTALPIPILAMVVAKCKINLWPHLPVSIQVKLLYPYDTAVFFGGYTWNVVEVQKDRALLLMNRLWRSGEFSRSGDKNPTWENSNAHKYLNGTLLKTLNAENQGEICRNQDGDYVFLLSESEAQRYLDHRQLAIDAGGWWLRNITNCGEFSLASYVDGFRQFSTQYPNYEKDHNGDKLGYRPALWVKLNPGEVENWEKNSFPISCKGRWTTKGKYDDISISLDRVMDCMRNNGGSTASNPDPMGYGDGVPVDTTGI